MNSPAEWDKMELILLQGGTRWSEFSCRLGQDGVNSPAGLAMQMVKNQLYTRKSASLKARNATLQEALKV